MRFPAMMLAALVLATPVTILAEGPEQLDQLEPGAGEWQGEYQGTIGRDGDGEHSLEAMFGLRERIALGVEIEAENEDGNFELETVGAKVLVRFTDDRSPVAVGLLVQAGLDPDLALAEVEARLIAAVRSEDWWAQGNVMVRRSGGSGEAAVDLAYAASLQHSLAGFAWLGIEASGQSAPVWRRAGTSGEHGHFAGPALTIDWEPRGGKEIEIGLAYLRRLDGDGPIESGRLFVQLSF